MAERTAGSCAADDAAVAWAAAEEAASEASAANDDSAAAELAGPEPDAAELAAAELPEFRSAGFVEVVHAASAAKAAIATTIWVRRAVLVRRAMPHAATPPARHPS